MSGSQTEGRQATARAERWLVGVLLGAYLGLALAYGLASPLYEPTDELRHVRYVRHIAVYHSLPVQQAEGPRAQSHHPPLYYALGALVSGWVPVAQDVYYEPVVNPYWGYRMWEPSSDNKLQYVHSVDERWPFRGITLAVYMVRWMTTLLGAGAVYLTYRLARELAPDQPPLALASAALVAFNPQFLYLSAAVNNDIPAALCGVAVLFVCARMLRRGPALRTDLALGALAGLSLLTKFHLAALLGLIALAYALVAWPRRDWRALLRGLVIVFGVAGLLAGWWFWRNAVLYGDPTGMRMVNALWSGRTPAESWWALGQSLPYLWSSLWGRFGYGQAPLPQPIYRGLWASCLFALCGYALPRRAGMPPGRLLALLAATCLAFCAVVAYYILIQPAGAMGRFLFPALPAFALLVALGFSHYLPPRAAWATSLAIGLGSLGLALYALCGVLRPAFLPPRPLSAREVAGAPNPTAVEFGSVARLVGYRVTPAEVEPGGTLWVTLYWQALEQSERPYAVFVHLLSTAGPMVAQRDTYPGLGRYPTIAWQAGVAFADTYRVDVPMGAYAPDRAYVQVGLYDPAGPRLTTSSGEDALRLAEVRVLPRPGDLPNALEANFGDQIMLAGYELDRRAMQPGETIRLTLYWRALRPLDTNYRVFAHVLGAGEQMWAQDDGRPRSEERRTRRWAPGQVMRDERTLTLVAATPPGFYDIEVGLYNQEGERLPVLAEDGHWLDNRVVLSKIAVLSAQGD